MRVAVAFLFVALAACTVDSDDASLKQLCEDAGGVWDTFPNSCADACQAQIDGGVCAQVVTDGCDCGINSCWNGIECVDIEEVEP